MANGLQGTSTRSAFPLLRGYRKRVGRIGGKSTLPLHFSGPSASNPIKWTPPEYTPPEAAPIVRNSSGGASLPPAPSRQPSRGAAPYQPIQLGGSQSSPALPSAPSGPLPGSLGFGGLPQSGGPGVTVSQTPNLETVGQATGAAARNQETDRRQGQYGQLAQGMRGTLAGMAGRRGGGGARGGGGGGGGSRGSRGADSPFTTPPPLNFQGFGGPGLGFGDPLSISQTYTPGAERFAAGGPQGSPYGSLQQPGEGQMTQGFGLPSLDDIGKGLSAFGEAVPGGLGVGAIGGGLSALAGFLGGGEEEEEEEKGGVGDPSLLAPGCHWEGSRISCPMK